MRSSSSFTSHSVEPECIVTHQDIGVLPDSVRVIYKDNVTNIKNLLNKYAITVLVCLKSTDEVDIIEMWQQMFPDIKSSFPGRNDILGLFVVPDEDVDTYHFMASRNIHKKDMSAIADPHRLLSIALAPPELDVYSTSYVTFIANDSYGHTLTGTDQVTDFPLIQKIILQICGTPQRLLSETAGMWSRQLSSNPPALDSQNTDRTDRPFFDEDHTNATKNFGSNNKLGSGRKHQLEELMASFDSRLSNHPKSKVDSDSKRIRDILKSTQALDGESEKVVIVLCRTIFDAIWCILKTSTNHKPQLKHIGIFKYIKVQVDDSLNLHFIRPQTFQATVVLRTTLRHFLKDALTVATVKSPNLKLIGSLITSEKVYLGDKHSINRDDAYNGFKYSNNWGSDILDITENSTVLIPKATEKFDLDSLHNPHDFCVSEFWGPNFVGFCDGVTSSNGTTDNIKAQLKIHSRSLEQHNLGDSSFSRQRSRSSNRDNYKNKSGSKEVMQDQVDVFRQHEFSRSAAVPIARYIYIARKLIRCVAPQFVGETLSRIIPTVPEVYAYESGLSESVCDYEFGTEGVVVTSNAASDNHASDEGLADNSHLDVHRSFDDNMGRLSVIKPINSIIVKNQHYIKKFTMKAQVQA